tara:strand:- start:398 stop:610 length:213 start_codon:yes stop_codon:yes gene_type:complete
MNQDDEQSRAEAASYENEASLQRTVTIPLVEYDKLKEEQGYIKDKTLIDIIDNIERLVRALRKHIIRTDV